MLPKYSTSRPQNQTRRDFIAQSFFKIGDVDFLQRPHP